MKSALSKIINMTFEELKDLSKQSHNPIIFSIQHGGLINTLTLIFKIFLKNEKVNILVLTSNYIGSDIPKGTTPVVAKLLENCVKKANIRGFTIILSTLKSFTYFLFF